MICIKSALLFRKSDYQILYTEIYRIKFSSETNASKNVLTSLKFALLSSLYRYWNAPFHFSVPLLLKCNNFLTSYFYILHRPSFTSYFHLSSTTRPNFRLQPPKFIQHSASKRTTISSLHGTIVSQTQFALANSELSPQISNNLHRCISNYAGVYDCIIVISTEKREKFDILFWLFSI